MTAAEVSSAVQDAEGGGAWQNGVAEGGWWSAERGKLLAEKLAPVLPRNGLVVDLGCGRGETVGLLAQAGAGYVVGIDAQLSAGWKPEPGRFGYVVCDVRHLPFRLGVADLVGSFDVIEHFADDSVPLTAARRLVRDGGAIALTVPALPGLWSSFDEQVGHHRRYTRQTLEEAIEASGIEPDETTYFFSWLAPAVWVTRHRDRVEADAVSPGPLGRAVSVVVSWLCGAERMLLRRWSLPFGSSLFAVGRPRSSQAT